MNDRTGLPYLVTRHLQKAYPHPITGKPVLYHPIQLTSAARQVRKQRGFSGRQEVKWRKAQRHLAKFYASLGASPTGSGKER